ncbi:MAG: hypothetical protein EBR88_04210, partial [Betaproteobacteria bacterium]|nr:hypothetical protein [Betaproteobacteria bacterium]
IKVFGACGAKLGRSEQAQIEAGLTGASPDLQAVPADGRLERRPDLLEAYRRRLLESVGTTRLDGSNASSLVTIALSRRLRQPAGRPGSRCAGMRTPIS